MEAPKEEEEEKETIDQATWEQKLAEQREKDKQAQKKKELETKKGPHLTNLNEDP